MEIRQISVIRGLSSYGTQILRTNRPRMTLIDGSPRISRFDWTMPESLCLANAAG